MALAPRSLRARHSIDGVAGIGLAFAVLAVSLILTFAAWHYAVGSIRRQRDSQFQHEARRVTSLIDKRLTIYQDVLTGFQGLYAASKSVERDEFHAYYAQLRLKSHYPGLIAVNFAELVTREERDAFLERVRSDASVDPDGYPDFAIHPPADKDPQVVINYLEPLAGNESAIGFDISSDPRRAQALERSRDTGEAAATELLALIQDRSRQGEPGFAIYFPVYRRGAPLGTVEERRAALEGYVVGAFRVQELLTGLFGHEPVQRHMALDIVDAEALGADDLVSASAAAADGPARGLHSLETLEFAGRFWRLRFTGTPEFGAAPLEHLLPLAVLVIGLIVSLLLFGMFWSLSTSRYQAVKLAERMTSELKAQHDSLLIRDQALAATMDGILITDPSQPDHPIIHCNASFERITGFARSEALGRNCRFLQGTDVHQPGLDVLRRAITEHRECRVTIRNYRKNGTMFWNELSVAPVFGADGRLLSYVGVQHDVTERKQAEEALQRVADIVNASDDAILGLDLAGVLTHWNPGAERLYGYAAHEAIGRPLTMLLPKERSGELAEILRRIGQGELIQHHETERVRKDGTRVAVSVTLSPVRDGAGTVTGASSIARDISAQRRFQQQQDEARAVLEQSNIELGLREKVMRSLLEDLQTAKKRIESQSQAVQVANTKLKELGILKDEFVAKVSHELRTPLTSVKEGLSLIADGALGATTSDQQDFLKTMDADIDRLTELINNMLDLSKIEAGRMRLARGCVSVRQLLETMIRSYQPITGGRSVRIEDDGAPAVFADTNRMLQVFANLFSNAIKFTPDDGTITWRVSRHNGMVSVAVKDSGAGIAPQDLPKLFQKFSQIGTPGAGHPRGTGLGLVVCKELTELHGGQVEVASDLGRGTTFTVHLPVYTEAFALAESLRELSAVTTGDSAQAIAIVAVRATAPGDSEAARCRQSSQLAEDIKQHVHRGDMVITCEPPWVAVLASADASGAEAIVGRLRQALPDGARLAFGVSVFPHDGTEAAALFACAQARAGAGA